MSNDFIVPDSNNSFIDNVNTLVNEYDSLVQILDVPAQVEATKADVETIYNNTNDKYEDTKNVYVQTVNIKNETETIKNDTQALVTNVNDKAAQVEALSKLVDYQVKKFESGVDLVDGIKNVEVQYSDSNPINTGTTVTLPDISYFKGHNILQVYSDGKLLIRNIDYEEVGNDGEISHSVKFLNIVPANTNITFYCASNSVAYAAQDTLEEATKAKTQAKTLYDTAFNNVIECDEILTRTKKFYDDTVDAYNHTKEIVTKTVCSVPLRTFCNLDQYYEPEIDCIYMYTVPITGCEEETHTIVSKPSSICELKASGAL